MNTEVNPLLMAEGETELMLNATTDQLGSWQKRLGTIMFGNQAISGNDVLGIARYNNAAGTINEQFIVVNDSSDTNSDIFRILSSTLDGKITSSDTKVRLANASAFELSGSVEIEGDLISYTGKSGNDLTGISGSIRTDHVSGLTVRQWQIIKQNDTANIRARFVNFLDTLIRVNGTDAVIAYNGASWKTTGNPINPDTAPVGSLIAVFGDRLFIAGKSGFLDRLYASSLPDVNTNITWATTTQIISKSGTNGFYIDINPEDGQNITALERNGNLLLILKERSLYTWDGNASQADILVDVGAVSQEAVITIQNITFFLGRSKKNLGIYAFTGGYPKLISRKIKRWINNINQANISDICSGADEDHVYFYIGNIVFNNDSIYGTRTFNNVWLVYTISQDSWSVYNNLHSQTFGYFVSSKQEILVFGDNSGKTFEVGRGQTDDDGEGRTPIDMEIWANEDTFGAAELPMSLHSVEVFSQKAQETNVHFRYDRNVDWHNLGALGQRYSYFKTPQRFEQNIGRTLQLAFTNNTNYQTQIDGYVLDVDMDKEPRIERGQGGRGTFK